MHTVCICNNCYSLLNDENPQVKALQTKHNFLDMKFDGAAVCPKCNTDAYLSDLANTMSNKKYLRLIKVREQLLETMKSKKNRLPVDVIEMQAETFVNDIKRFKDKLQRL